MKSSKKNSLPTEIFYPDGTSEVYEDFSKNKLKLSRNIHWYSPLKSLGEGLIMVIILAVVAAAIYLFINFVL